MSELTILQAVRLKVEQTEPLALTTTQLIDGGQLLAGKTMRVSPDLQARLKTPLAEERSRVDQAASVAACAEVFRLVISLSR
jgi:hypothetical protein